jgi:acyl carrier protein
VPDDPALVGGEPLPDLVRRIVAEVLVVPLDKVRPESALVADLGAESIDFQDQVFRLEQALGRKIPLDRWGSFVQERLDGQDLDHAITTEVFREFAEHEAALD